MRARGQCKFLWSLEPGHAGASTQVDHIELAVPGAPAESSLSAKSHPVAMRADEMAVVEGRFSPAPIRGRLQGDLSGVGPAQETAGAPHGSTAGPCTVPLDWCSFGFYERKFSRASDGHVLGPAVPQALPTRPPRRSALTSTSCSFEFASATYGIL